MHVGAWEWAWSSNLERVWTRVIPDLGLGSGSAGLAPQRGGEIPHSFFISFSFNKTKELELLNPSRRRFSPAPSSASIVTAGEAYGMLRPPKLALTSLSSPFLVHDSSQMEEPPHLKSRAVAASHRLPLI